MKLKPWYKVVTPREDLREGKPLDAAEFAVHLDKVRDGAAHPDYRDPQRFFARTFLTQNLLKLSAEAARRLAGEKTATSAVFNMTTQFGGGKTHALTLLYHLATLGPKARAMQGVDRILQQAGVKDVPKAATAVFVGTQFDSLKGRGGDDGTPLRKTPWGEIAWQLGGKASFAAVEEHDQKRQAPAGDVIRDMLPKGKPAIILLDEIMNYVSSNRKSGMSGQLYTFLQNLSEEARSQDGIVMVASIPASELEMTADDEADYKRFKKMLDRLGKAVIMASESETSEIIRRRLFEWDPQAVNQDGRVLLNRDALATCAEYADWVVANKAQIPSWFVDHAREAFEATYPFHPMVLSVFERKWQELPRFQQTRGVLRLLALWVSRAYQQGYKQGLKDPLITLGSAPLEDSTFRTAAFEQLGENKLEGAVTTDIAGRKESHAIRLDAEAEETLQKAQVHKKTATVIFFESNGGQHPAKGVATVPEIRLGVADPDLDLGNIETALEALTDKCYYLGVERNQYRFSLKENLNKRFTDRRASIRPEEIEKTVREEVQKVFPAVEGVERVFFPEKSSQVPDRPVLTFAILAPEHALQDEPQVMKRLDVMTREYGNSSRGFKSAIVWIVPEASGPMHEEARKLLAWLEIESEGLKLDEAQQRQLGENIKKARRDLRESVWKAHNHLVLLAKDNTLCDVDLGPVTSSAAESLSRHIVNHLRQTEEVLKDVSPRFLVRNWPGQTEWSTKGVRDAFFASPKFPRLLSSEAVKDAIARGVGDGTLAYVGRKPDGTLEPVYYKTPIAAHEIELSDDMFIITGEEAEKRKAPPKLVRILVAPAQVQLRPGTKQSFTARGLDQFDREMSLPEPLWSTTGGAITSDGVLTAAAEDGNYLVQMKAGGKTGTAEMTVAKVGAQPPQPPPPPPEQKKLTWSGEVPAQKWMNLYTKVLTRFVSKGGLRITVTIEAAPSGGVTPQQAEETKAALRELGLEDDVKTK